MSNYTSPVIVENVVDGDLQVVHGSVTVASPTISLAPTSLDLVRGGAGQLTAELSTTADVDIAVALSSSCTDVATVPASVTIAAGTGAVDFDVTGQSPGEATITAAIPGSTATASVTVEGGTAACVRPSAVVIAAPSKAARGKWYAISWTAVLHAMDYVVEESSSQNFANATTQVVTTRRLRSFTLLPASAITG